MSAPVLREVHLPLASARYARPRPTPGWDVVQRVVAGLALLSSLPVLACCALAIKLTSPGPVCFVQSRRGRDGQPFRVFKLRTLRIDNAGTELGVGRAHSSITPLGRLLRELKLDELPQLWNVVRGEMLLVGPRPLPIALDDTLRARIPGFDSRYRCAPGLTNLAQVVIHDNGTGESLVRDWQRRWRAERHYIARRSWSYDLIVIGLTLAFLVRRVLRPLRRHPASQPTERAVLGVRVSALDYTGVLDRLETWVTARRRCYVGVTPVHSLMDAVFDSAHRAHLRGAALNTADGVPVVWALRALGAKQASRVYGPELMLRALARAEQRGWRVAFYGGHEDRLPRLLANLRARFPKLDVVAAISPPFRALSPAEDASYTAQLQAAKPDLVWVGLGAPKQEAWMSAHERSVPGVKLGVGAAFDFHAGAVRQAPAWIQRVGLEWAFRLACEPRRLAWRYLRANPLYVVLIALQIARQWAGRTA